MHLLNGPPPAERYFQNCVCVCVTKGEGEAKRVGRIDQARVDAVPLPSIELQRGNARLSVTRPRAPH